MNLKRGLINLLAKKPEKKLTWSVKDFNRAKFWAKGQPHPNDKNKTLWGYLNQPWKDSTEILHEVNMILDLKEDGTNK